jgi:hypothetical protein
MLTFGWSLFKCLNGLYSLLDASSRKKCLGITYSVRNRLCYSISSPKFWVRFGQIIIRCWPIGFSFHDLFFIRYFKQKDAHYERDLIPVLQRWCNQDTNLQFHPNIRAQSFHNMFLNLIDNMYFFDRNSVARDHLDSYHYSDNRSFELFQKNVGIYNNMVGSFINGFTGDIEIFLKTRLPNIRQYRQEENPQSNFYHYSNIIYYFWLVYWQSRNGRHETHLEITHYGNAHHLRISTGGEPIASMNSEDDVIRLQTFISNMTTDAIFRLNLLNQYRNETIEQYAVFRQNIEQVVR